jgi:hypothetical protein
MGGWRERRYPSLILDFVFMPDPPWRRVRTGASSDSWLFFADDVLLAFVSPLKAYAQPWQFLQMAIMTLTEISPAGVISWYQGFGLGDLGAMRAHREHWYGL